MATAAKISIQIDAQTAMLQKGFADARGQMQSFAAGMSGHIAAGMAKFQVTWQALQGTINAARGAMREFSQSVDQMSSMQDWSDRLGIAADELAVLGYAAEQTGASQEGLNGALQKMQNNLSDAGQEGGAAVKALRELNLSAQRMHKLAPDKQFAAIADAMSQVKDQGDRTRLTLDIFGKSGGELNNLLREGRKGLEEYGRQATDLGYRMGDARKYMEEFGDEMHKVEVAWQNTKNNIAAGWVVVLEDETSRIGGILRWLRSWVVTDFHKTVGVARDKLTGAAEEMRKAAAPIAPATRGTAAGFSALQASLRGDKADLERRHKEVIGELKGIRKAVDDNAITIEQVDI